MSSEESSNKNPSGTNSMSNTRSNIQSQYQNYPPQIINQDTKKTIEIIIKDAEFKKPFNYFIVVQLDGNEEKRRTRVSKKTNTPSFEEDKFYLPLQKYDLIIHQTLIISAFNVVDSSENIQNNGTGQAKLLGENMLELAPLTGSLTNIANTPIMQRIDL